MLLWFTVGSTAYSMMMMPVPKPSSKLGVSPGNGDVSSEWDLLIILQKTGGCVGLVKQIFERPSVTSAWVGTWLFFLSGLRCVSHCLILYFPLFHTTHRSALATKETYVWERDRNTLWLWQDVRTLCWNNRYDMCCKLCSWVSSFSLLNIGSCNMWL